jgi:hypothetical protein
MTTARCRIITLMILSALTPAAASAAEMDCKPGVKETTYAEAEYRRPPVNIHQARGELEAWGDEKAITYGGHGSYDPKTGVHMWAILFHPKEPGVILSVEFTSSSDEVKVVAENICQEDQGDWRPGWKMLNEHLIATRYTLSD